MEFLAAILGFIIGLPIGIWAMKYVWRITSEGYWGLPPNERVAAMAERRANAFNLIMMAKIIAKGGGVIGLLFILDWLRRLFA